MQDTKYALHLPGETALGQEHFWQAQKNEFEFYQTPSGNSELHFTSFQVLEIRSKRIIDNGKQLYEDYGSSYSYAGRGYKEKPVDSLSFCASLEPEGFIDLVSYR